MKTLFLKPSYFIWIVVLAVGYLAYQFYGLPHVLWSYDWRDDGQGYSPYANRYYVRCTVIGPYGSFTTYPNNGECDWIAFHKAGGAI